MNKRQLKDFFTDMGMKSVNRAHQKLIKAGICAIDGSGDDDVERLFIRIRAAKRYLELHGDDK